MFIRYDTDTLRAREVICNLPRQSCRPQPSAEMICNQEKVVETKGKSVGSLDG